MRGVQATNPREQARKSSRVGVDPAYMSSYVRRRPRRRVLSRGAPLRTAGSRRGRRQDCRDAIRALPASPIFVEPERSDYFGAGRGFLWAPAALWSEICSPHSTYEDEWQAMQEPELGPRCYPMEPLVIGGAAGHYFLARSSRFVPG